MHAVPSYKLSSATSPLTSWGSFLPRWLGGHLVPLGKGLLRADGSPASRPGRVAVIRSRRCRGAPSLGEEGWSCWAFPSARARVGGRLLRGEAGPHHLKERQGPPNYRAARGYSREVVGMPSPGHQRSVLRYPRVPRIPEVLGFPEVPDWLTEPRLAGSLQLERF